MKRTIASILLLIIAVTNVHSQDYPVGLKLATPQQLAGIPLASTPFSGQDLPEKVDLSDNMPPVGRQVHQDCVAWAVAYGVKSYQEKIEEKNDYVTNGQLNSSAVFCPSFIYNQINNGRDGGSFFQDALNVLSQQGAAKMYAMPYDQAGYTTQPSQAQKEAAKIYKIDFWRQVNIRDIKEVKAQLNAGYPVMIGSSIDEGFRDNGVSASVPYVWRARSGSILGGHAMVVVGYNNAYNAFKILNSWGTQWGNGGYCWISYDLFPQVVNEGYIAKDASNGTPTVQPQPQQPVVNNPIADLKASFTLQNVQHNLPNAMLGPGMNFTGMVQIPAGIGHTYQIVIRFYFNNGSGGKGMPVGANSVQFSYPDGSAATGTQVINLPPGGGTFYWNAGMPYLSLRVNRGQYNPWGQYVPLMSYLIAEPVLYVDNFAVQAGGLVPFYVNL